MPSLEVPGTSLDAAFEANRNIKMKRTTQVMKFLEATAMVLVHGRMSRAWYLYVAQTAFVHFLISFEDFFLSAKNHF